MRRFIYTIALLIFTSAGLIAQGLQARTYLERTTVGPKMGTAISYNFKDKFELGGFYQQAMEMSNPESGRPLKAENTFCGAYFGYPLMSSPITTVKLNVRTGLSNGENFVITPSIIGTFHPIKLLNIGGGIGIRSLRPTLLATLSLNLSSRGNQQYLSMKQNHSTN